MYSKRGLSIREIVDLTNSDWTKTIVTKAISAGSIERTNFRPPRTSYGEKISCGKRVPHLREQKISRRCCN